MNNKIIFFCSISCTFLMCTMQKSEVKEINQSGQVIASPKDKYRALVQRKGDSIQREKWRLNSRRNWLYHSKTTA